MGAAKLYDAAEKRALPELAAVLIAVELPGLPPQNALILLAGNPECLRKPRIQIANCRKCGRGLLPRRPCCLMISNGTGRQNDNI